MNSNLDKKKVGVVCVCLNEPYWQYAAEMLDGVNRYFLKHPTIRDKYQTDTMLWSDIPEDDKETTNRLAQWLAFRGELQTSVVSATEAHFLINENKKKGIDDMILSVVGVRKKGMTIFPTEPIEWPMPTLLRYNLFLQQEEKLREYDYLFYVDVDMRITDWIGEEILGEGLTASEHPMYALRQGYHAPYEDNPESTAYVKRSGKILEENGKKRFQPYYYAGGFQGGKTDEFIKAMKIMKKNIEDDFNRNYIARWNDESHWNKYLFDNPPEIVLSPSYIYPDSLLAEYYYKVWGRNYSPKIMTLTKKHSTSSEAGKVIFEQLATM